MGNNTFKLYIVALASLTEQHSLVGVELIVAARYPTVVDFAVQLKVDKKGGKKEKEFKKKWKSDSNKENKYELKKFPFFEDL